MEVTYSGEVRRDREGEVVILVIMEVTYSFKILLLPYQRVVILVIMEVTYSATEYIRKQIKL